jgi:hypothetical protein
MEKKEEKKDTETKIEEKNIKSVWFKPEGKSTNIFCFNSYPTSGKKTEIIIPNDNLPNTLNWYTCGKIKKSKK